MIELYRDDLYPAIHLKKDYESIWDEVRTISGSTSTVSETIQTLQPNTLTTEEPKPQTFYGQLKSQHRKRKLWERFDPRLQYVCPPRWDEFNLYDMNNGYLAYCLRSIGSHKIFFRNLDTFVGGKNDASLKITVSDLDENGGTDENITIITRELKSESGPSTNEDDYSQNIREVTLSAPCIDFTFDISQDLLVTLHGSDENR